MGNKFLALRKSEVAKVAPDRAALMGKVDMKTIREADRRWLCLLFGEPYEAKFRQTGEQGEKIMKKIRVLGIAILTAVVLCACGGEQELADISTAEGDGYMAIIWEERTYVPFCAVSKNDCGTLIGYVNGDTGDRVCEYKDYPSNEWIAN